MNRIAGVLLAVLSLLVWSVPAAAAPLGSLGATYQASPPVAAGAGTTIQVPVTLTNSGTEAWTATGTTPVRLSYHWYDAAGAIALWDGARTALAADVAPGAAATVTATIVVPAQPASYLLKLALVKEGVAWLPASTAYPVQAKPAYQATFGIANVPSLVTGATYTIAVPVTNSGTVAWNATGANLVDLAYHWHDANGNTVVWDGARTALGADLAVGAAITVNAQVTAPATGGSYTLSFDLVREGLSWFQFLGSAPLRATVTVATATYAASYTIAATTNVFLGESRTLPVTVINSGNVTWNASGSNPINLGYHILDASGRVVVWDGARTAIGTDLLPGQSRTLNIGYTAPGAVGTYTLAIDTVREGVAWFSGLGSPTANAPLVVTSGFNGGYDQTTTPSLAAIGAVLQLSVRVSNYGARAWPAGGSTPVHLSYHLFAGSAVVVWDGLRGNLPNDVGVGQSAVVPITVQLPASIGSYTLSWDLVQEGVAWFSSLGVNRLSESITVQPGVTFYGKGFGHGVGMSQYGAEGWATGAAGPALTGQQIVAKYYSGTTLAVVDSATNARGPMRVLLSAPSSSGSATCGQAYLLTWLNNVRSVGGFTVVNEAAGNAVVGVASPNATFQIAARNGIVQVYDQSTATPTLRYSGSGPVTLVPRDPTQPITIQEKGEFVRGKVQYKNDGGNNLRVVNFVGYDDYVRGVVPKEMPAGWNIEAYKAQALAARSYGFTSTGAGRDYDVRDDQIDQCYGGATVETTAGNQAVAATAGQVITYNGAAIRAYFASSNGGYSVGVGCWNHGITCAPNDPWLVPVADPADLAVAVPYANKYANWQVTFSSDQIRNALLGYRGIDIGSLQSVDVSNQAPAGVGHVVAVTFRGAAATLEVPADIFLRTYLGLRSTMVRLSPF